MRIACMILISMPSFALIAQGQNADVRGTITVASLASQKVAAHPPAVNAVVWLSATALDSGAEPIAPLPGRFRMAQKDKQFEPHLLVVPIRSTVEFPNLDPFFHNVFSQFNGKRFDLGLYEAGSSKGVRFDHEGISYIFCNIHPEMGAVIVTLATPYFAIAAADGKVSIHDVPSGSYVMHLWVEGADAKTLEDLTRTVHISPSKASLGDIAVHMSGSAGPHKNKFGEDYRKEKPAEY